MLAVQRRSLLNQPLDTVPLTFTRPSVAYTWDGKPLPPNTPRFEQLIDGKLEYGCLIEQAHTNYDTASESQSPTYTCWGTTPPTVINHSDEHKLFGEDSCKITFNVVSPEFSDGVVGPNVQFNHPDGATLTYMAWIYSETAFTVTMAVTGGAGLGGEMINILPGLHPYFITVTNSTGGLKSVGIYFYNASALATMYICGRQIVDAPFPLSWTLGGTTQAAETLTAPSSVLNLKEGTIELEYYHSPNIQTYRGLIGHNQYESVNSRIDLDIYANSAVVLCISPDGGGNQQIYSELISGVGFKNVSARYNAGGMKVGVDGDLGADYGAVNLPSTYGVLTIGCILSPWSGYALNSLIRNVTISHVDRTPQDITARNNRNVEGHGFGVDRQVKLYAPLMHDLRAWRVRT